MITAPKRSVKTLLLALIFIHLGSETVGGVYPLLSRLVPTLFVLNTQNQAIYVIYGSKKKRLQV